MSSVLQCRNAGDVVNNFEAVLLSERGDEALVDLVNFIIDIVIKKHYSSKQSSRLSESFMKLCTTALNAKFPKDDVDDLKPNQIWTTRNVLGAAFALIEHQHMIVDTQLPNIFDLRERFRSDYSENILFHDIEGEELSLLALFRLWTVAYLRTVKTKNLKKEAVMFIAGSLSEGKMTTYIMGGGQNIDVDRREAIYHQEASIPMKPWTSKKIASFNVAKRKAFDGECISNNTKKKNKLSAPAETPAVSPILVLPGPESPPPPLPPCASLPIDCCVSPKVVQAEPVLLQRGAYSGEPVILAEDWLEVHEHLSKDCAVRGVYPAPAAAAVYIVEPSVMTDVTDSESLSSCDGVSDYTE